jgi:hypothetical protein
MRQNRRIYCAPHSSLQILLALCLLMSSADRAGGAFFELRIVRGTEGTEEILYHASTHPMKTFSLSYTHSLDKCPVVEIFRIEKDATITQTEEIYGWFGAGLEFNPKTGFTDMKDHKVHIKDVERNMPFIPIRVGWISDFRLEYDYTIVPLTTLARPGELLLIKIFRIPGQDESK